MANPRDPKFPPFPAKPAPPTSSTQKPTTHTPPRQPSPPTKADNIPVNTTIGELYAATRVALTATPAATENSVADRIVATYTQLSGAAVDLNAASDELGRAIVMID